MVPNVDLLKIVHIFNIIFNIWIPVGPHGEPFVSDDDNMVKITII